MARIRVLHIITSFALGGAQDYLLTLLQKLDREKFDPMIAAGMRGEWVHTMAQKGNVPCFDVPALQRDIHPVKDLLAARELVALCRSLSPAIVHTHSSKAGVLGRIAAAKAGVKNVIHTVHGFPFHRFMPPWKRRMYEIVERKMARMTSVLAFVSQRDRLRAEALGIMAREQNLTVYYGIDFDRLSGVTDRSETRRQLGLSENDWVIGFTGRFDPAKGLQILLRAFAKVRSAVPHARLLLVGDGSERPSLERLIKELGIGEAVVISGFRDDVSALLNVMDVFVMTSLWEGLSRSLVEAMFAKVPVIATDVGGTGDAVRTGETGILIPANDVQGVVDALTRLRSDPNQARQMAREAHMWAARTFSADRMGAEFSELYSSLVNNKPIRPSNPNATDQTW